MPGTDDGGGMRLPEGEAYVRVEPSHGWAPLRVRDLWEHRELVYFLTWRDIKVRYKQTLLGAAWAILQPLLTMLVFSLFFGKLAKVPSDGVPYPLFAYVGLLPWSFFAASLAQSAMSVVWSANVIKKVYFPRLVVPISGVLSGGVDLAIAFGFLLVLMVYYHVRPTPALLLLPAFFLLVLAAALGVGMWLSALNVQFRDVRHAVPFLAQLWMFATPVAYPSSLLGQPWRTIYGLNPLTGVVEGFRWTLLGTRPPGSMLLVSALVTALMFVSGAYYFRRMERTFADLV